jgi:hypothetical protein
MSHHFFKMLSVLAFLALILALPLGPARAFAMPACAPVYVSTVGMDITVSPTGSSDTANLQCAFDAAVASGPGVNVRLVAGAYHTGLIVVNGFHGQFTGAGSDKTLIYNLPDLYVTPVDFYFEPPSAANPSPYLFAFLDGQIEISNLAFSIGGGDETTGWSIFGISPPIRQLAAAVVFEGTHTDASVDQVLVAGEADASSLFGYSIFNGIYFEGFIGEVPPLLSGTFRVTNSTFRAIGSATPYSNITNATVVLSHNVYEDVMDAVDGTDAIHSTVEFSHNQVNANTGFWLYNMFQPEDVGSTFIVRNNHFQGQNGILFDQTFGADNHCLIQGNHVNQVSGIGVMLGAGTRGCTVVGGATKTNVLDLGTGNILTGINNMGTGIGPQISILKKVRK